MQELGVWSQTAWIKIPATFPLCPMTLSKLSAPNSVTITVPTSCCCEDFERDGTSFLTHAKFSGSEDLSPGFIFIALVLPSYFTAIKRPEASPIGLIKLRLRKKSLVEI